ncbi:gamma-glutamylcyclotransferase [Aquisalimonas sp. 2447]|uniref:gamma-glutamylcyclotransferase family protein n=1 Tax=Aquisalimonas sp. 2447 TaxID=2740807 RepID=UPI0014326380|nr:gamma-glutamylcyclotransferase family protein [Aquisalimonas sp. 2447]QIT54022.1 gamma-glutamylcyclotransferase [Aquisalimonas sp. 2447]
MARWRRYFAYGSNMLPARLLERTPSAVPVGVARLSGHAMRFHHVSRGDGTAKCNIVPANAGHVWGVVYDLPAAEQPALDRAEDLGSGYEIEERRVLAGDDSLTVFCYVALPGTIDPAASPFRWYRDIVLAGARLHRFPDDYLRRIAGEPAIEDPDARRDAHHRRLIEGVIRNEKM